jgi:hypothetical protein
MNVSQRNQKLSDQLTLIRSTGMTRISHTLLAPVEIHKIKLFYDRKSKAKFNA